MAARASAVGDISKTRQSVIDVGQRNMLENAQGEIRRNNELLTSLRRENKELRSVMQQSLRGQQNLNADDQGEKEEELMHNKICVLKRSLNAVKAKNQELVKEIERTTEENVFTQQEGGGVLDEDSATANKIRALENRLDKCLVKHNEVNTIRRTYETLLARLQLEQGGFDTQLTSTEQALQATDKELHEVVTVWKESAKSRDNARTTVAALKTQLVEDRQKQRKDLDQRRLFIEDKRQQLEKKHEALLQKLTQQEERHATVLRNAACASQNARRRGHRSGADAAAQLKPEEVEEVLRLKAAYLRLRDTTMSTNVTGVLSKLQERTENYAQLQRAAAEQEAELKELESTCATLQTKWEEVNRKAGHALVSARVMRTARDQSQLEAGQNGEGSGASESPTGDAAGGASDYGLLADRRHERRIVVEEFRQHLEQCSDELTDAQATQDALVVLLRDVDYGIQHIAEKLSIFSSYNSTQPLQVSNSVSSSMSRTTGAAAAGSVDLLRSCGAKMQLMLEELSSAELDAMAKALTVAHFALPNSNIRSVEVIQAQQVQAMKKASASRARSSIMGVLAMDTTDSSVAVGRHVSSGGSSGGRGGGVDDYPENEIHDRHELKMMSLATVEREQQKAWKLLQQRRKEEAV